MPHQRREALTLRERHRLIGIAVHQQPGYGDALRRHGDVEAIGVPFVVVDHVGVERQDFTRPGIHDVLPPRPPPRPHHVRRPAMHRGDRGPRHERGNARIARRVEDDGRATSRVTQQADARRRRDIERSRRERIEHPSEVFEVSAVGGVTKSLGKRKGPCRVDARPAEVECHRHEAGSRQAIGERGEHPPVLEALEPVHDHHRRTRCIPTPGPHIHQDRAQHPRQLVGRERRCRHQDTAASSRSTSPCVASRRARTPIGNVHWSSMWPTGNP